MGVLTLYEIDVDYRLPWNSPANRKALAASYLYTYEKGLQWVDRGQMFPETNVLAITGPGTALGDGDKESPKCLADIPKSTIIAVEVRSSGIPWPAPGDFDIRTMPRTLNAPDGKGISSCHTDGFHVVFADAHAWFISEKIPFETLEELFTIAGAAANDRETLLGGYVIDRGPRDEAGNWVWDVPREVLLESVKAEDRAWIMRGEAEWQKIFRSGWTPPLEEDDENIAWGMIAVWGLGVLVSLICIGYWLWRQFRRRAQPVPPPNISPTEAG